MLEKNKDYVEFTLQCTTVERTRDKDYRQVCFNGYSDFDFPGVPMDVVCKEFDHRVIVVGKRDFEKMQADVNINAEIAKQWEINYDLLLKKIGFDTVEELVNYLDSEAECDTLREAIASLEYSVKFARDERRDLSKKLEECEKDYISERDKAEVLQTENEQLKKKLEEFSPVPGYREFLTKIYPEGDVEKLVWATEQICGGKASANGWMVTAKLWRRNYETLSKLIGFSSVEEIQDYLTNEAECDTLHEAILKLIDENKYSCDEWCKANSSNNSWKAATGCDYPEEAGGKINNLIGEAEAWESDYNHLLALTGFDNEGEIEDFLEQNNDRNKLTTVIDNLKLENEAMKTALRVSNLAMQKELDQEIDKWQVATGRSDPEAAKQYIDRLKGRLNKIHGCSVDW